MARILPQDRDRFFSDENFRYAWLFDNGSPKYLKKFFSFDAKNPQIYQIYEKYALEVAKQRSRYSVHQITGIIRWEMNKIASVDTQFKIDSGYAPYYCRLLIYNHPDLIDIFEIRKLRRDHCLESPEEAERRKYGGPQTHYV